MDHDCLLFLNIEADITRQQTSSPIGNEKESNAPSMPLLIWLKKYTKSLRIP